MMLTARSAGVAAGWPGCVSLPTRQTLNIADNAAPAQASHSAARTHAEPAGGDASAPTATAGSSYGRRGFSHGSNAAMMSASAVTGRRVARSTHTCDDVPVACSRSPDASRN